MTDLSATVAPKSDQLTADDLIAGSLTITITKVSATGGEQPIAINFEGDGEKPYLPCKSMRRVLIFVWGKDGQSYVGRSMTVYRDPKVKFGGIEVGGIRISHMSHMSEPMTMALTATKANKKPYKVLPLVVAAKPANEPAAEDKAARWLAALEKKLVECTSTEAVRALLQSKQVQANLVPESPEAFRAKINALFKAAQDRLAAAEISFDDDFPGVVTPREAA